MSVVPAPATPSRTLAVAAAALGAQLANRVINSGLNRAADYVSSTTGEAFNSARSYFSQGRKRRVSGSAMPSSKRRRVIRRRRFRARRRMRRRSNYKRVKTPVWTGARYNKRAIRHSLNTNFKRNDYDSVRVMAIVGSFVVDGTFATNNLTFVVNGGHVQANFPDQFNKYEEFRLTNIQYVVQPRTVGKNQSTFNMIPGHIPYLLVREGDPADTGATSVLFSDALITPGYRYVPLMSNKRTVFNVTPGMTVLENVAEFGAPTPLARRKAIGWLKTTADSIGFDQAQLEIVKPAFSIGSDTLDYDVYCYLTCHFRGNHVDIVPE